MLACLIRDFLVKLNPGVSLDSLPLMSIPDMVSPVARELFRVGYRSVTALASASVPSLQRDLMLLGTKLLYPTVGAPSCYQHGLSRSMAALACAERLISGAKSVIKIQWRGDRRRRNELASGRKATRLAARKEAAEKRHNAAKVKSDYSECSPKPEVLPADFANSVADDSAQIRDVVGSVRQHHHHKPASPFWLYVNRPARLEKNKAAKSTIVFDDESLRDTVEAEPVVPPARSLISFGSASADFVASDRKSDIEGPAEGINTFSTLVVSRLPWCEKLVETESLDGSSPSKKFLQRKGDVTGQPSETPNVSSSPVPLSGEPSSSSEYSESSEVESVPSDSPSSVTSGNSDFVEGPGDDPASGQASEDRNGPLRGKVHGEGSNREESNAQHEHKDGEHSILSSLQKADTESDSQFKESRNEQRERNDGTVKYGSSNQRRRSREFDLAGEINENASPARALQKVGQFELKYGHAKATNVGSILQPRWSSPHPGSWSKSDMPISRDSHKTVEARPGTDDAAALNSCDGLTPYQKLCQENKASADQNRDNVVVEQNLRKRQKIKSMSDDLPSIPYLTNACTFQMSGDTTKYNKGRQSAQQPVQPPISVEVSPRSVRVKIRASLLKPILVLPDSESPFEIQDCLDKGERDEIVSGMILLEGALCQSRCVALTLLYVLREVVPNAAQRRRQFNVRPWTGNGGDEELLDETRCVRDMDVWALAVTVPHAGTFVVSVFPAHPAIVVKPGVRQEEADVFGAVPAKETAGESDKVETIAVSPGTQTDRLAVLPRCILRFLTTHSNILVVEDVQDTYRWLIANGVQPCCHVYQPSTAFWLLSPDDHKSLQEELGGGSKRGLACGSGEYPTSRSRNMQNIVKALGISVQKLAESSDAVGDLIGQGLPEGGNSAKSIRRCDSPYMRVLQGSALQQWELLFAMAVLLEKLKSESLLWIFVNVEMPVCEVLSFMSFWGVGVNPFWASSQFHIRHRLATLKQEGIQLTGRPGGINFLSSEECGKILFDNLQIPVPPSVRFKKHKNGAIAYSTSMEVLKGIAGAHPLVEQIAEYRRLHRVLSAARTIAYFARPLSRFSGSVDTICYDCRQRRLQTKLSANSKSASPLPEAGWRVYCVLEQRNSSTGRLSCRNPNLLCLDKPFALSHVRMCSIQRDLSVISSHQRTFNLFEPFLVLSERLQQVLPVTRQKPEARPGKAEFGPDRPSVVPTTYDGSFIWLVVRNPRRLQLSDTVRHSSKLAEDFKYSLAALFKIRLDRGLDDKFCDNSHLTLREYWQQFGFYKDTKRDGSEYDVGDICQVHVILCRPGSQTVDPNSRILTYPSDQVWRLDATADERGRPDLPKSSAINSTPRSLSPVAYRQNQPVDSPIRRSGGDANRDGANRQDLEGDSVVVNVRDMVVASNGRTLLSFDYAQLELRLIAHYSEDPLLVWAFRSEQADVFTAIAASWMEKDEIEVTALERAGVKKLCYGMVYGIGSSRLAEELNITVEQAAQLVKSFMSTFHGVTAFLRTAKKNVARDGYVQTLWGRKRYLPHIHSRDRRERRQAERQAVNTLCQASAADLVKVAMVNVHNCLRKLRRHCEPESIIFIESAADAAPDDICPFPCRLLLQIHDELLFDVQTNRIEEIAQRIRSEMESVITLRVPLIVACRMGPTWGTLGKFLLPKMVSP